MSNKKRRSDGATKRRRVGRRPGFTLVEALVAVALLLAIILFVAKIFGSASDVTAAGSANADVMQEVAAIERQVRDDIARLSHDGYMVILCTAVRNDINDPSGVNPELWLDPNRNFDAYIRSDRLLFFTQGTSTTQVFRDAGNINDNRKAQSTENRVYYGHGFQLGDPDNDETTADDVAPTFSNSGMMWHDFDLPPWYRGSVDTLQTTGGSQGNGPTVNLIQPRANLWTLARQNILLADDGGGADVFAQGQASSTASIWDVAIRDNRFFDSSSGTLQPVDAAASRLNDIQQFIYNGTWFDMVQTMMQSVMYPRAERRAPSMFRADHATTVSTLGSAVSDFVIDWTYGAGSTGLTPDPLGGPGYAGVSIPWAGEVPWFGLADSLILANSSSMRPRGVYLLADEDTWDVANGGPIFPDAFEFWDNTNAPGVLQYVVVFGPNQTRALNERVTDPRYQTPLEATEELVEDGYVAYTPWPRSLRITMRLHDTRGTFETGRIVQFVVDLPRQRDN